MLVGTKACLGLNEKEVAFFSEFVSMLELFTDEFVEDNCVAVVELIVLDATANFTGNKDAAFAIAEGGGGGGGTVVPDLDHPLYTKSYV